jgi:hypothetical protein
MAITHHTVNLVLASIARQAVSIVANATPAAMDLDIIASIKNGTAHTIRATSHARHTMYI